jgi:hypothetical protein
MASGLSGRQFGWRLASRLLLFLTLMFGVPLVLFGLDRFYGDPDVTLTDAVRVTTGTIAAFYIYSLFGLLMARPCWLRLRALAVPPALGLFVPLLILLDLPFFLAARSPGIFGLSVGWPDAHVPVYLITALGLAIAMIFARPKPKVAPASQRWLGVAMLVIGLVIIGGYAFIVAMSAWLHVVEATLSSEDAPHPALVPLILASGRVTDVTPLLCAALLGSAAWWVVASRRLAPDAGAAIPPSRSATS